MQILSAIHPESTTEIIFYVIGGLGIFLYGLDLMGNSLKALAGNKLKIIIEKSTNTPLKGILVGMFITVLIQSSSGTTALSVGLVRAGLMSLPQAVGVIMGANIGTTVTAFLIGLKIKDYALPIVFIGASLVFFFSKKKYKNLGGALLGFGLLFFGLDAMGSALKPLASTTQFQDLMLTLSTNRFNGVLVGTVLTAIVQSSSASIGVLQELYEGGYVPLVAAIPILLGSNIGTTVTAIFASIGGSVAAKRTAAAHVIFNVVGTLLFLLLLTPYTSIMSSLELSLFGGVSSKMTIAFAHMGFNIINTFIMFWFIKYLVLLVKKIIPSKSDEEISFDNSLLEERLIEESSVLALTAVKNVIGEMSKVVYSMFTKVKNYSIKYDSKEYENILALESTTDTFDRKTHDYLVKLSQVDMSSSNSHLHSEYVDTIRDLERIGDHCQNLLEFFNNRYEDKESIPDDESQEIEYLFSVLTRMVENSIKSFNENRKDLAELVLIDEDLIDNLVKKYRKKHILRMKSNNSSTDLIYVDILSNMERIGDHCTNISQGVLYDKYFYVPDHD